VHPAIHHVSSCGLLIAVHLESYEANKKVIDTALRMGVFTDWFLFAAHALRIAPPLTITESEIQTACRILLTAMDEALS
jgi:4-aminobutyrate aminotransferase-like enzyme